MTRAIPGIVIAALFAGLSAAGQACSTENDPASHTKVGQQMPGFTVVGVDGKPFSMAAERGKVTVVNFWATWCGPCKLEIPRLETEVWQTNMGNSHFAMIAIAREQDARTIVLFQRASHFTFPIASDPARSTYKLFADSGIPRTYLIGATGKILFQSVGYCPNALDQLRRELKIALEGVPK